MLRAHILVVDDSPTLRAALRTVLESLGCVVTEAPNGRVALGYVRAHFPELVLVDLDMPALDGWQFVEALRQDFRTADLPALGMTARDDVGRDEALRSGLDAILRMPFTLADLQHAITRLIGERDEPPEPNGLTPPSPRAA